MSEVKSGIYKIVNVVNNKIYIGSAFNLKQRKSEHFSKLKKGKHVNIHLQRSFNKHGIKNFEFKIIEYVENKAIILDREQYWIDFYGIDNIYNICSVAGNTSGIKQSKESVRKRVEKITGMKRSNETKAKMSLASKGRKLGPMSDAEKKKRKDNSSLKIKIICIDTNIIYESIIEAARQIGCRASDLVNLLKGRQKTVNGLHFMKLEDYNNSTEFEINIIASFSHKRKVICIEDNIVFNSINEASKKYDIERRCINQCCAGRTRTAGGYHWKYAD